MSTVQHCLAIRQAKLSLASVCSIGLLFAGVSLVHADTFRISGKYLFFPEEQSQSPDSQTATGLLSTSVVVVSQDVTHDDGEKAAVELASGEFKNGNVDLTGTIEEPGLVEISVYASDNKRFSIETFLSATSDVRFALMEHEVDYIDDKLLLVGKSRQSTDPAKRFSISGTLTSSTFGGDLSNVAVIARTTEYDENGEIKTIELGEVLLDNGAFLIESDMAEPRVVDIHVDEVFVSYFGAYAVVEPGAEIVVSQKGSRNRMFATSEGGRHAKLIESWQGSDEYVAVFNAWEQAYATFQAESMAKYMQQNSNTSADQAPDEEELTPQATTDASGEKNSDQELDSNEAGLNTETSGELGDEEQSGALADLNVAAGCEHVDLNQVTDWDLQGMESQSTTETPMHQKYQEQMWDIEASALERFAQNVDEPMNSLLALELGAFGSGNEEVAVRLYEQLARLLDSDLVARRVEPARAEIIEMLELEKNKKNVAPGQKAPEFRLADLESNEIELYDVLASNELVLLDFWASWCGPCIASFPHLKQIYSTYKDKGFEIVAVAIDETHEEWEQASSEQDLPWINVGENKGWEGPTTNMYAVDRLPLSFLIDTEGCILRRNIATNTLEELLVARYGERD